MYTEADLQALVPRKIFDRGAAYYYEDDAVGRIKQKDNTYKAKVKGTETYRVELTVLPSGPPKIYCDCPYDYGDVCKHGIALGLAVLDLLGPDEPVPALAPAVNTSELPTTQQLRQALIAAFTRTSDKEKIAYLGQLLYQQPDLIQDFLVAFEFSLPLLLAAAPQPKPRPVVVRYRTFVQIGQEMLRTGSLAELLPHLLRYDWRSVAEAEAPQLATLLLEAARQQPEPTLDAVMERVETYLAATQRGPGFYPKLVSWLTALHTVPAIAEQVRLFASELWQQHSRRVELRNTLTKAGFAPLPSDLQEEALRRKVIAKPKEPSPKRSGRAPRSRL